jgi:hypothetical protein
MFDSMIQSTHQPTHLIWSWDMHCRGSIHTPMFSILIDHSRSANVQGSVKWSMYTRKMFVLPPWNVAPSPPLPEKRVNYLRQVSKPFTLPPYPDYRRFSKAVLYFQLKINLVNAFKTMKIIPKLLKKFVRKILEMDWDTRIWIKYLKLATVSTKFSNI